jgi:glycosyltransferase involved in cell wall biosynthesis
MNIGFEAKRFFTNYTGLGNYSRFVIDALSLHIPEDNYFLFTPREKMNSEVSSIVSRNNVQVIQPGGLYTSLKATSLWRSWGASHTSQAKDLSIFHGLSQELPFGLTSTVKKVVTVHDLIFLRFPQFYHAVDIAIYKAKVQSACKRADKIIAVSSQTAQDLVQFLKVRESKIEVIHQGCHPNFKRAITMHDRAEVKRKYALPDNYMLNVGTIEERKNLIVLIKAMALLPAELQIPLVVVGRPTKYYEHVEKKARELSVFNKIIFLNDASFADFPAIYQGAEVFVYPSLFEGFGIPLVEAIESGVPVITSIGSCFSEAAGPHALYVDPHDATALASQLQRVLTDTTLKNTMVVQSKAYVQKFAPEVIARDLNNIYKSVLATNANNYQRSSSSNSLISSNPIKISATIITLNEEKKIEGCLQSLQGVVDEILVVDSFSTDQTKAICERYNVRFIQHAFEGYVAQKNYAASMASHNYILALDADERLSDELRKSILKVKVDWGKAFGYAVNRYNNYCGKWMHFSGWYPERKVRLWDRREAGWVGTDPHDFVRIPGGKVQKLEGHLLHYAYLTVDEHLQQVHRFAEIAARAKYKNGAPINFVVNIIFSPLFRFVKSYIFQLGFLDGYYGFIFCTTSASMTFFKYVRLYEYRRKGLPEEQRPLSQ